MKVAGGYYLRSELKGASKIDVEFCHCFFAYQARDRALESKIHLKTKRICSLMRAKKNCFQQILLLFVSVEQFSWLCLYTQVHNKKTAGKQGYHQNFDPSLPPKSLWLIFMGMKQKSQLPNRHPILRLFKKEFFGSVLASFGPRNGWSHILNYFLKLLWIPLSKKIERLHSDED